MKIFIYLLFITLAGCASSPQKLRNSAPYYSTTVNSSIVSAISCVSKQLDALDPGIADPLSQSVNYLPGAIEGTIYISSSQINNIAFIDFLGAKPTSIKLYYNTNVLVVSDGLKDAIEKCK